MDRFAKGVNLAYFKIQKQVEIPDKWILLRKLARKQLSWSAQLKLEWIIFYHTTANQNAKLTATQFAISRKTLHKWLGRFDERNLKTLEEQSTKPKKVRGWMVTRVEEERIIDLRKKNMELGKKKLKRIYLREYKEEVSTWKIERVIRKHKLYPDPVTHDKKVEKNRRSEPKIRIHEFKRAIKDGVISNPNQFGFLWHIDAIIIWWYGQRRVIFTAMEDVTKIAFARVYTTNSSTYSEDFLKRLMYLVEGKVEIMHSDNGSEFAGEFEKAAASLHILQIFSRPYTPKDNPALERFNSTIQYEWLQYSPLGLDDILQANLDLTKWLVKYNSYRPHEALDYDTPLEYAQKNFFDQVLPMWSAYTKFCISKSLCYNYLS